VILNICSAQKMTEKDFDELKPFDAG